MIPSLHRWTLPVCLDLTLPVFSSHNYSSSFKLLKDNAEVLPLIWHLRFWRHIIYHLIRKKLLTALGRCSNMSSGPLGIYNQMVSYLPPTGGEFLLSMYNNIWPENSVSVAWGEAVVFHVLKQGKNCSDTSYRPVSLTSCVKTMVCMVNHQLVCLLENRNIYAQYWF